MKQYFEVIVRYPDGVVKKFLHVSGEHMRFSGNYFEFTDENGKLHMIMGATVIADEESSKENANALPGDALS